jgi:hypothetical protein
MPALPWWGGGECLDPPEALAIRPGRQNPADQPARGRFTPAAAVSAPRRPVAVKTEEPQPGPVRSGRTWPRYRSGPALPCRSGD